MQFVLEGATSLFTILRLSEHSYYIIRLRFLLPDGRWQSFEIPQLEIEAAADFQIMAACISSAGSYAHALKALRAFCSGSYLTQQSQSTTKEKGTLERLLALGKRLRVDFEVSLIEVEPRVCFEA